VIKGNLVGGTGRDTLWRFQRTFDDTGFEEDAAGDNAVQKRITSQLSDRGRKKQGPICRVSLLDK